MQLTYDDLVELKGKIETSKQKQSELTGQKNSQMEILKTDLGCDSLEAAEKKIETLTAEVEELEEQIKEESEKLQEDYPQLFTE